MPHVLTKAYLSVNSVDYSSSIKSLSMSMSVEELDASVMGSDTKISEPGLKEFSLQAEFLTDFAASGLDKKLWDLWDARSKVPIEVRPDSGAVSTSNPKYTFKGFTSSFDGLGGGHGELAMASVTIKNTTKLTRATS